VKKYFILFSILLFSSCHTGYFITAVVDSQQKFDTSYTLQDAVIEQEILPYRTALEASMDDVLVVCAKNLVKAKPESPLGNLLANATLSMAKQYTGKPVDLSIMNYGGIRVPSISAGNVTLGNAYELMPFDNFLVTLELSGTKLNEVLQKIAAGGGWPVAGIQFKINNGKAVDIKVKGIELDLSKVYVVAISDYLANGGDNLEMLKELPQYNTNVLLRDAFIEYFRSVQALGQLLDANNENRIVNE
jgi:2',3'-cyclic-nucleotide 2'-phosphodiesterase (5'-nucleotidase family)